MESIIAFLLIMLGIRVLTDLIPFIKSFMKLVLAAIVLLILSKLVPGYYDELLFISFLIVVLIVKLDILDIPIGWSRTAAQGSEWKCYVLNKRTGVIHDIGDPSVDTISEKNRRYLTWSEAEELVRRGTRYRYKEEFHL